MEASTSVLFIGSMSFGVGGRNPVIPGLATRNLKFQGFEGSTASGVLTLMVAVV